MYMGQSFAEMLRVGGKTNSLGRSDEVIDIVLNDKSRLKELYDCLYEDDAWLRMRAIDSLEKICRLNPDWLELYTNKMLDELIMSDQPSIKWHLAQMITEMNLSEEQKQKAMLWLKEQLLSIEVDWIVAANVMDSLAQFTRDTSMPKEELTALLKLQQQHRSKSVVKRATKLLNEFAPE